MTKVKAHVFWITAWLATSRCRVRRSLTRLECGSVQMKPASMSLALLRPGMLLRHSAMRSLDSQSQSIHAPEMLLYCCVLPRDWKRKQPRHCTSSHVVVMPSATSTSVAIHDVHMFIALASI
ncbi:putative GPI-anchored hypothetical protein [Phytophthora infestans T30-4]|uniref:Uncharacterized protein n=1 Tax=Phytophthora infestans (strain T30-4) TaxID=403677 RepID=D0NS60_PHYIT|nr:putative GPI-anchored hypothetical protein [Phytophthora infestans T30-4]EEY63601.1 putative GPI-anchored hypothetical protein [Phytophthora infestans T30-4]|eukprot:XP_002898188.1 putative GPI-anchored hypothetical protein [Phytophthora infestans T30-4]